jgi:hypothetical protein
MGAREKMQAFYVGKNMGESPEEIYERVKTENTGYMPSSELEQYYAKLQEVLANPEAAGFGMTEQEMADYMRQAAQTSRDQMQQAGGEYDVWAAQRGIEGGPEAKVKLKLLQENMRNLMRAKTDVNALNYNARTQARLQALGLMGNAANVFEQTKQMNYQQMMLQQMQDESVLSNLLGLGTQAALNYFLPGSGMAFGAVSSGIGATSAVPTGTGDWYNGLA